MEFSSASEGACWMARRKGLPACRQSCAANAARAQLRLTPGRDGSHCAASAKRFAAISKRVAMAAWTPRLL